VPQPVPTDDSAPLSKEELAVQADATEAEIDDLVDRRLIGGPGTDGLFDRGNVTRVRLIKALDRSGISVAALTTATAEKGLSFEFADRVVAEPVGLAHVTAAEACEACGIDDDLFRTLMLAIGVAVPEATQPIREDDLELVHIVAGARDQGLPVEAIVRTLRSFAISMHAVAEAERDLFRRTVEEPALAGGMSYTAMFAAAAAKRIPLQRLAYRAAFLLHRRLLEQLVYDNLICRFEEALGVSDAMRGHAAEHNAIVFVDLSGFTERTENRGDRDAAAIGSTLIEVAQTEAAIHRGNLVKPLGDGAMLHFARPDDAVRGAIDLLAHARRRALPPARAARLTVRP
jgi:hypothetical protein